MKKICLLLLLICTTSISTSCGEREKVVAPSPTKNANQNVTTEKNGATATPAYESSLSSQTPDNSLVYINSKCGYQLTFPESWRGYYVIDEINNDIVRINFFGKSKTGTISLKPYGFDGLPMFMIIKESALEENLDSVRKIGTVNGINYYFATGTGSYLGGLYEIADTQSAARQTADYEVDEIELDLAKKDWEKVQ